MLTSKHQWLFYKNTQKFFDVIYLNFFLNPITKAKKYILQLFFCVLVSSCPNYFENLILINANHLYQVHTINLEKLAEEFQYQKVEKTACKEIIFHNVH